MSSLKIRTILVQGKRNDLCQKILDHYSELCEQMGRAKIGFMVDSMPGTVNHMYQVIRPGKNTPKKVSFTLEPWVQAFRIELKNSMVRNRIIWRPKGVSAAVLVMHSPYWITQEHTVREMVADNRVKPIFDAIQKATGQPDQNHWQFHVFKAASKKERLEIYLFDLGDL